MMKIDLPARVLDFSSTNVPEPELVLGYLPKDTSYAERHYQSPDGFNVTGTVVLMGTDRTSIHNADYCLRGQGLNPDEKKIVNAFHRRSEAVSLAGLRMEGQRGRPAA